MVSKQFKAETSFLVVKEQSHSNFSIYNLIRITFLRLFACSEINKRGGKAVKIYCDHSDGNAVKNLFEKVALETGGKLNILVNAAFSGLPVTTYNII